VSADSEDASASEAVAAWFTALRGRLATRLGRLKSGDDSCCSRSSGGSRLWNDSSWLLRGDGLHMRGGVTGSAGVDICSLGRALDGRDALSGPNIVGGTAAATTNARSAQR